MQIELKVRVHPSGRRTSTERIAGDWLATMTKSRTRYLTPTRRREQAVENKANRQSETRLKTSLATNPLEALLELLSGEAMISKSKGGCT